MLGINPADEYLLYEPPVEFFVNAPAAPPALLLAPADPARVALIMSVGTSNSIYLGVSNHTPTAGALTLAVGADTYIALSWQEHGALCQAPWYCLPGSAAGVAYAVALRQVRPPSMYGYPGAYTERQAPAGAEGAVRRARVSPHVGRRPLPAGVRRILAKYYPKQFAGEEP